MKQGRDAGTYTVSSGNVFADLGVADPEEALTKAELAYRISSLIAERKLTQAAAAELLGIDQPKVSALTHGRVTGFSIERLLRFLTALDQDVQITIAPKREPRQPGRMTVIVTPV